MSPKTRKRTPLPEESVWYQLDVVKWAVGSTDALQIDVTVRFEAPVNGVEGGDLLIYSDADSRGGSVNYDKENSRLRGCLWIGSDSAQALIALLAAGRRCPVAC